MENTLWLFIHNLIAHPLLALSFNSGWAESFHDWTANFHHEPIELETDTEGDTDLKPVHFPQVNFTIGGREVTENDNKAARSINSLPLYKEDGMYIAKFVAEREIDRQHFAETGEIYIMLLGENIQPFCLTIANPFEEHGNN